jgi:hypothetical protein
MRVFRFEIKPRAGITISLSQSGRGHPLKIER